MLNRGTAMGRSMRGGLWKGWKEETQEAYENGGASLGEYLTLFPDREPEIWNLIKDVQLWPRKYLKAFRAHFKLENPEKHAFLLKKGSNMRYRRKDGARTRQERQQKAAEVAGEESKVPKLGR
jgi:hypothetical protein